MAVQQKSARAAIALALNHRQLAVLATATAAVAVLPAFATCIRRFLPIIGEIARIVLSSTTLMATIGLVVSHDLSPHVVTQESLCSTRTSSGGVLTQWVLAKADGLRERTGAGVCGVLKLCSRTFGEDQARIPSADAEFSASAGVVKLSAEQFLELGYWPRLRKEPGTWRQHSPCKFEVSAHDNDARLRFLLACHPCKINPIE